MLQQLLEQYGYLAILIGTFFEGETILVLGALAAHRGYLDLWWVIFTAFTGSLFGDQLWFFVGRRHGAPFIDKRPTWKARSERARALMEKYNTLFILTFRFLYGLRSVSSLAIGMTSISFVRFAVLNFLGAVVWALGLGLGGYLLGELVEIILGEMRRYEMIALGAVCAIGAVLWISRVIRDRRRVRALPRDESSA